MSPFHPTAGSFEAPCAPITPEHVRNYQRVLSCEAARIGLGEDKSHFMGSAGLHGKSELLKRLASGKRAMVYAPPTSFSYPWYSVIEDAGPWQIAGLAGGSVERLLEWSSLSGTCRGGKPCIVINQSLWQLVEIESPTSALVSYRGWGDLGFRWRLSIEAVPAAKSPIRLASLNPATPVDITTLEQLRQEQSWQLNRRFTAMRMAAGEIPAPRRDHAPGDRDVASMIQLIDVLRAEVIHRLRRGQESAPSADEAQALIDAAVAAHFEPDRMENGGWYYSLARDGCTLMHHAWWLCRIAPVVAPDSIYMPAI